MKILTIAAAVFALAGNVQAQAPERQPRQVQSVDDHYFWDGYKNGKSYDRGDQDDPKGRDASLSEQDIRAIAEDKAHHQRIPAGRAHNYWVHGWITGFKEVRGLEEEPGE
jgi:hypothetical protein